MNNVDSFLEKVSSEIHVMWTKWAKEMIKNERNISEERIKRRQLECFLPYEELSEDMKELDRKFTRKILDIVNGSD